MATLWYVRWIYQIRFEYWFCLRSTNISLFWSSDGLQSCLDEPLQVLSSEKSGPLAFVHVIAQETEMVSNREITEKDASEDLEESSEEETEFDGDDDKSEASRNKKTEESSDEENEF
jgi:hypothetical protein